MVERVLDWKPKPDPQSMRFLLGPAGPDSPCTNLHAYKSIRRFKNVWLDQGSEGACTGFGEETVRALTPFPKATDNEHARSVYHEARIQDEWPGEAYEGSSVNGAMKAARKFSFILRWYWATTMEQAKHGLSHHGAGELGIWWYTGMFNTDSDGFVRPSGKQEGGHALALAGYQPFNGGVRYRLENSWGQDWGDDGGCWIWEQDLQQLLNDNGELAFPAKDRTRA